MYFQVVFALGIDKNYFLTIPYILYNIIAGNAIFPAISSISLTGIKALHLAEGLL